MPGCHRFRRGAIKRGKKRFRKEERSNAPSLTCAAARRGPPAGSTSSICGAAHGVKPTSGPRRGRGSHPVPRPGAPSKRFEVRAANPRRHREPRSTSHGACASLAPRWFGRRCNVGSGRVGSGGVGSDLAVARGAVDAVDEPVEPRLLARRVLRPPADTRSSGGTPQCDRGCRRLIVHACAPARGRRLRRTRRRRRSGPASPTPPAHGARQTDARSEGCRAHLRTCSGVLKCREDRSVVCLMTCGVAFALG